MQFNGEGIQHIALLTDDLLATVDSLRDGRRAADDARRRRPTTRCSTSACRATARTRRRCRRAASCSTARTEGGQHAPAAADLLGDLLRPGVLRVHPAQGRRGLRRRQLQGAVRVARARPDRARRAGRGVTRTRRRRHAALPVRLRQRVRHRGAARRAAGRPQLAAALRLRPLRRAALRHRLHRAARATTGAPGSTASARRRCTGRSSRIDAGRIVGDFARRADAARPAALEPAADARRADRLRRRPGDDGRQRRPACAQPARRATSTPPTARWPTASSTTPTASC